MKIAYFYEPKAGGPTDQMRVCQRTAGAMETSKPVRCRVEQGM